MTQAERLKQRLAGTNAVRYWFLEDKRATTSNKAYWLNCIEFADGSTLYVDEIIQALKQ